VASMLRLALSLSLASLAAAGINLDDHFSRSTKLQSPSQLDSQVSKAVNGGKTLFVRIIASDG